MQVKEERQTGCYPQHSIVFQMVKKLKYGKALYVSGSLQQLGQWNPSTALRLAWKQGDKWQAQLPLPGELTSKLGTFQFKFMISDWQMRSSSQIQWQAGCLNRRINIQSIFQGSNLYCTRVTITDAEWGLQNYIFFLKTQDYQEKETYYMQGSIEALGSWREKRAMKRLGSEKGNPFINYWKNNPEFAQQSSFSRIFMLTFSVSRDITSFNYFYISFGNTIQSQSHPGRAYNLNGGPSKDRIMQFDWQGSKVVIDESTFDQMILQRFTNQIYLASQVQNLKHFQKINEKKVTVLVHVMAQDEEYKVSCFNLRNMCKQRNLSIESRIIGEVESEGFAEQVNGIVDEVDQLVIKGHRVCLTLSNKVMRMLPIHMLCLILFSGCSFGQALEITSHREKPPESQCKNTREIYNFISGKLMRGRSEVEKQ